MTTALIALLAGGCIVAGLIIWAIGFGGRKATAEADARDARAGQAAAQERVEMHAEGKAIDDANKAASDDEARKKATPWARG